MTLKRNPTTWHETGMKQSLLFMIITIKEVAFDKLTILASVSLPFKYVKNVIVVAVKCNVVRVL